MQIWKTSSESITSKRSKSIRFRNKNLLRNKNFNSECREISNYNKGIITKQDALVSIQVNQITEESKNFNEGSKALIKNTFTCHRCSLPEPINKLKLFSLHDLTDNRQVDSNGYIKIKGKPSINSFLRQKITNEKLIELKERLKQKNKYPISRNHFPNTTKDLKTEISFNTDCLKSIKACINLRYTQFGSEHKSNQFSNIFEACSNESNNERIKRILSQNSQVKFKMYVLQNLFLINALFSVLRRKYNQYNLLSPEFRNTKKQFNFKVKAQPLRKSMTMLKQP